jgi:hypothetical protein
MPGRSTAAMCLCPNSRRSAWKSGKPVLPNTVTSPSITRFVFVQISCRPERYGASFRFETMPSRPILQACE